MRHDAFRLSYFKNVTWVHSLKTVGLAAVREPPFGFRLWKGVQIYRCYSAKTQTIVQLREPLGRVPAPKKDLIDTKDGPTYPTVVSQARENIDKHKDCVLLTKVGSFYEMYFEQAEKWGPLLNLKVAQKFTAAGYVPMVSSTNALNRYKLVAESLRPGFPSISLTVSSRSSCRTSMSMWLFAKSSRMMRRQGSKAAATCLTGRFQESSHAVRWLMRTLSTRMRTISSSRSSSKMEQLSKETYYHRQSASTPSLRRGIGALYPPGGNSPWVWHG